MWRQNNQDLVILVIFRVFREKVPKQRYFGESWPASQTLCIGLGDQSTQNVRFAFFQANIVINRPLADDRLGNAADIRVAGDRRYLNFNL